MNGRGCAGEATATAQGDRLWRSLVIAGLVLGIAVASIVAPPAARGATLVLDTGEQLDGTIVNATRNSVIVRLDGGGMRQLGLTDIRDVRVDVDGGQPVIGRLITWAEGVYQILTGSEVVWVTGEGRMLAAEAIPDPTEVPVIPDATAPPEAPTVAPTDPPAPSQPARPSL
jgi:hypothetical protein